MLKIFPKYLNFENISKKCIRVLGPIDYYCLYVCLFVFCLIFAFKLSVKTFLNITGNTQGNGIVI